jgi:hypothetical protein
MKACRILHYKGKAVMDFYFVCEYACADTLVNDHAFLNYFEHNMPYQVIYISE